MSYDEVVMPMLDAMQNMHDTGENNKAYKGATAFFDSCDEAYFVKKKERKESHLIVTLEPMK